MDDDPAILELAAGMLSAEGDLSVDTAPSGEIALEKMATAIYDAVVSDFKMPGLNGIDLLREARSRGFKNIFIIFTARGDEDVALDAILNGADHYLPKTAQASQDMALIRSILQKRQKQAMEDREKRTAATYQSLVMRMSEGFAYHRILYDDTGRPMGSMVLEVNDAFERIVGVAREAVLGRDIRELMPDVEGFEHSLIESIQEMLLNGKEVRFEEFSRLTGRWLSLKMYTPEPGHFITLLEDITLQKGAEEGQERDAEFYLQLLEDLPNPIWFTDKDGNCGYLNQAFLDLTGRNIEEEMDLCWDEGIHPDDQPIAVAAYNKALESRSPFMVEYRLKGADGKYHHITDHGIPIKDSVGAYLGLLGVCTDRTQVRELEAIALEGEDHYAAMFHGSHAVMLLIDGETAQIVDANQAAVDFYQYPREQLIGLSIDDVSTSDASGIIRQIWKDGKNPDAPLHRKHHRSDGEVLEVDVYLALVTVQGRTRILDLVFDVNDRVVIAETLERERRDYEMVFNSTPIMIAIRDAEGRTIRCNRAFAERMGKTPESIVGMSIYDLMPRDAARFHEDDLDILRTGQPHLGKEMHIHLPAGDAFWGLMDKLPYKNSQGAIIGVIAFAIDITKRKMMEEELELTRKKIRLLGSITRHDLLNQITALNGYLGIAQMKAEAQPIKDYMAKALRASEGMTKIIDFSRDYEKMGSQRPEWQLAKEAAETGIGEIGGEAKVTVELAGLEIYADRMIQKVFHNLTDNSVRHGKATSVRFYYERVGDEVRIVCEDNGKGVPKERKDNLFDDRFAHGLFLVKEVLKMTGLTIAQVPVDRGARFEIIVPSERYRLS